MTNLLILQGLNGLQFGILLFLVAAGLTLVFGVMDVINLAHGSQYMVGAYLAAAFAGLTGSFLLGLLCAVPLALAFGLILERLVIRRLYDRSHLDQVLVTFGLMLMLNEGVRLLWGSAPISVEMPEALSGSIPIWGNLRYPVYRLAILAAGLGVAAALWWAIHRTRMGMLLRAGASNRAMVSALGTDINRLFLLVFGAGAMLAGFAGAMMVPVVSAEPDMGDTVLILTFVVIVIGGIGSIRGAFVAALLVGLVDTLGRTFGPILLRSLMEPDAASQTGRTLAPMLIYILMAAILAVRPAGLFPVQR
ncbi:branched-chain amino acid ABC transporter permease [Cereibacter azotoformans]|uniref:Amino acid/amide ABC transporter membrane protein 1 (HAAT family) n=1 Tax=Cereibacter azotoformans TaxID=43057 RepID=A0A2T5KAB2_9RHOB|nr:branched-chain amino acid ABC transporter permease [Cereibacter azotoformans]AXQ95296.1 branched-chain amino acid ABC transporter permease [Cereibacter sphaeroides]PTR19272.1 amino acid/amide ABC transporter membrane protein 1 (HAAT family) [Cereibacter azotoformans]UIJ32479.1 branched-chain amino acid ABC transporter permease [Cereibacter azotoformans]ULB11608.1 branched-chain amino acid ABC transporter permease [Cereibacter azotoformans]